jgi:hypothetical protein
MDHKVKNFWYTVLYIYTHTETDSLVCTDKHRGFTVIFFPYTLGFVRRLRSSWG